MIRWNLNKHCKQVYNEHYFSKDVVDPVTLGVLKTSQILKQTCNFQLQVSVSVFDLFVDIRL